MKSVIITLTLAALVFVPPTDAESRIFDTVICDEVHGESLTRGDNVDIDIEDGSILFEKHDRDETVEITEDYELYINGERIALRRSEQNLVRKYHRQFEKIIKEAKEIGLEGARVGAAGAKMAVKAVGKALAGLGGELDTGRLEKELDEMEEDIEERAGRLEDRAEEIEKEAEELENLHRDLRRNIRELDELGWF